MMKLWETWWGSGDEYFKEGSDSVFSIVQGAMSGEDTRTVCCMLDLLRESKGKLLVREAYLVMLKRMQNAYSRNDMPGVIVTGQSGIGASPYFPSIPETHHCSGKSVFSVLVLAACLSKSRPVVFSNSRGISFLFDSTGVRTHLAGNIVDISVFFKMQHDPGQSRTWVLANSPLGGREHIASWFAHHKRFIFYAVFSSPIHLTNHSSFRKDLVPHWTMPVWSIEEIEKLYVFRRKVARPGRTLTVCASTVALPTMICSNSQGRPEVR